MSAILAIHDDIRALKKDDCNKGGCTKAILDVQHVEPVEEPDRKERIEGTGFKHDKQVFIFKVQIDRITFIEMSTYT